jgi:hypothetical protein
MCYVIRCIIPGISWCELSPREEEDAIRTLKNLEVLYPKDVFVLLPERGTSYSQI